MEWLANKAHEMIHDLRKGRSQEQKGLLWCIEMASSPIVTRSVEIVFNTRLVLALVGLKLLLELRQCV